VEESVLLEALCSNAKSSWETSLASKDMNAEAEVSTVLGAVTKQ
jgi:uncharacterized protein YfiM (DUF2279 family)